MSGRQSIAAVPVPRPSAHAAIRAHADVRMSVIPAEEVGTTWLRRAIAPSVASAPNCLQSQPVDRSGGWRHAAVAESRTGREHRTGEGRVWVLMDAPRCRAVQGA
jgi:hypothetical protein